MTDREPGRRRSTSAAPGRWGGVLPGLVTTTMVTVLMFASVFQRRSRSGFLDELEMVRGEALTAPRGEVATAVAMADAAEAQDRLNGEGDDGLEWTGWPGGDEMDDDKDQIWTEPSPHPIRPHEMWHASGTQSQLSDVGDNASQDHEDLVAPDDVVDAPVVEEHPGVASPAADGSRRRFARFRPVDQPGVTTPRVDGPEVPVIPSVDGSGLLGGPVRRRTRSGRDRRPLPDARPLRAQRNESEDHSPLVDAPLPPAAASAVPAFDPQPTPQVAVIDLSTCDEHQVPRAQVEVDAEVGAEVVRTPLVPPAAAEVETAPEPRADLVIDDRSELAVGSTVVRFGDGSRTSMAHGDEGPVVQVHEGWCWVTVLGDGPCVSVRVELPQAEVMVTAGGRALALVEPDGSVFVVVFAGTSGLSHHGDLKALDAGSMVLLSTDGTLQIDHAEADELAADPLVAHNLELDVSR